MLGRDQCKFRSYSHCASFCNFNVVELISFAIPPAILPNSLFAPVCPGPFDINGCFASLSCCLPFALLAVRAERDLMELSVEWNSDVLSLGAISSEYVYV